MGVWLGPLKSVFKESNFSFSNDNYQFLFSGSNWELVLKSSGDLIFNKNPGPLDVFIVAGGATGGQGSQTYDPVSPYGGNGGAGGQCLTQTISVTTNSTYKITIGGNGENSIAFAYEAVSGGGSPGGTGANIPNAVEHPTKGTDAINPSNINGVLAFGEQNTLYSPGTLYGAGGGAGGLVRYANQGFYQYNPSSGGTTGGGQGAEQPQIYGQTGQDGGNGTANTGSGGGGASYYSEGTSGSTGNGGLGGSGIVIIRNHRSS